MAQYLRELCELLLQNHAGELAARIFSTLCTYGRLTIWGLATNAKAPLRKVKQCVTAMLERQLLYHYTAHSTAPTYFAPNYRGIYNLARCDNIVNLVTDRYGEGAGRIVNNIQHLGLTRIEDLAQAYKLDNASTRDSGVDLPNINTSENGIPNGTSNPDAEVLPDVTTLGCFHATMRTLLQSGILVKFGPRSFIPPVDLQEEIEETVIIADFPDRKITGPKKKAEFEDKVSSLKRKWRAEDEYSDSSDLGSKGARRPGDFLAPPSKRLKTSHRQANGVLPDPVADSGLRLSNDLIVRVDVARCGIALRSKRLEHMARRFLGQGTAGVYGALLMALECKMNSMRAEYDIDGTEPDEAVLPKVTVKTIVEYLEPTVDLWSSITGMTSGSKMPKEVNGKRKHLVEEDDFSELGIKREHHSGDEDDEHPTNDFTSYRDRAKRENLIEAHLAILEEHPKQFCTRVHSRGDSSEWRVNFPALTKLMIEGELDGTCLAREGEVAQRITRMLREHGHLEEKEIAKYAMVHVKDLEHTMTHLQTNGLLEPQEIPKDNTRNPMKCFYLWNHDPVRSEQLLIQQTYKAMARTLQRLKAERVRYKQVIMKAERTDVQGHEDEKLEKNDLKALREWRDVEERLLTQVSRMDEVIALLRDFGTTDKSLSM